MEKKLCTQCSSELEENVKFCPQCGAKVEAEKPTAEEGTQNKESNENQTQQEAKEVPGKEYAEWTTSQGSGFQGNTAQFNAGYQMPPQGGPTPPPGYGYPPYGFVPQNMEEVPPSSSSEYEPISTLGFFGIFLLLGIPLIGPILTIIWACGGCRKINKRNYCRALILKAVIALVVTILLGIAFSSAIYGLYQELSPSWNEFYNYYY